MNNNQSSAVAIDPKKMPKVIQTELGAEKICFECGEYWPLDDEFFFFQWGVNTKGEKYKQYTAACKACYNKRYRPRRVIKKHHVIRSGHEKD